MKNFKHVPSIIICLMLFSTVAYSQGKSGNSAQCDGSNTTFVNVTAPPNPITATSRFDADNKYKDYVEAGFANWTPKNGYFKVKCPDCPNDKPKGCDMGFFEIKDIPVPIQNGNSYTYSAAQVRVDFTCTACTGASAQVASYVIPSYNTVAMCDGNMNMTTLFVPSAIVSHLDASTPGEAREVWIGWISSSNGEGFDASMPWGCPGCQIDPQQACPMLVDTNLSTHVPYPIMDNGDWLFPSISSFNLAYECNECGQNKNAYNQSAPQVELVITNSYPNPANNLLNIEISEKIIGQVEQIEISDLLGRKVFTQTEGINQASGIIQTDVSSIPAGNYILELHLSSGVIAAHKITISK